MALLTAPLLTIALVSAALLAMALLTMALRSAALLTIAPLHLALLTAAPRTMAPLQGTTRSGAYISLHLPYISPTSPLHLPHQVRARAATEDAKAQASMQTRVAEERKTAL